MEKITRKELKKPDLFLYESAKIAEWGAKNAKLLVAGFGTIVTVGVIWTIWGSYNETIEQKAQTALFDAQKNIKQLETPAPAASKDKKAPPPQAVQPTYDQYKPSLDKLRTVVDQYPGTQAAVFAALEASRVNFEFKKYGDSIALLEKVKNSGHGVTPRALALNALAVNYVGQGDCNSAVNDWNQIETRDDMNFLHPDVYLNKGLCFEHLGQKDKATEMYKKAEAQNKNPEIAKTAKKYLRLMK